MRIATVDAVSGNIITATLSIDARGTPIRGSFVILKNGEDTLLGRVVSVDLTNMVHANPTFGPYIMQHGSVPLWSGDVDIECAKIELISAVDADGNFVALRRNPPSGTSADSVTAIELERFCNEERRHTVTLGAIPNAEDLPAAIINRSFGPYEQGGYGEARHAAIFGQNGSGKTVLATALIAGRLAANPDMGLFMPDTAGDLSHPESHSRGSFRWNYETVLTQAGVHFDRISIADIRLTEPATLRAKLIKPFRQHFAMNGEKAEELARIAVATVITDDSKVTLAEFTSERVLTAVIEAIPRLYAGPTGKQKQTTAMDLRAMPGLRRMFDADIEEIRSLFDGREEIGQLIRGVLQRGRKVIVDMHTGISGSDQEFVMREVMTQFGWRAQKAFRERGNNSCNALIVLDEGQRWIPQDSNRDDSIAQQIKAHMRETRKYGVGWLIVAQSPSGIHNDVLRQAHTIYFGRGLGVGADREHLEKTLGAEGCAAYKQLELQGGYFWVARGQDNNIGTESSYFSLRPFGGDATAAFIAANPHIFDGVGQWTAA